MKRIVVLIDDKIEVWKIYASSIRNAAFQISDIVNRPVVILEFTDAE